MALLKPTAILFDWDNTLVDTWPIIHRALSATLTYMGHEPWPIERVKADAKRSMRDYFPDLFGDRWQEASDRYQQDYRSIHLEEIRALKGAEDMLKALTANDVFVALVSNKRGVSLRLEVNKLGWEKYFKASVGADDAERDKPHPAPAHLALKGTGIEDGPHIWFVGDTGVDLECAQALGATPILYGDHETNGRTHDGFPYARHVRDHAELQALFAEIL
jgi:phosphoglycolate phosphatase